MFISAAQQKKHMPACFKRFKNLRVIIDAAEFRIEMPSDFQQQGNTVMADRGFNVKSEFAEIGVDLIKRADFNKGKQFMNPRDEVLTEDTATARIYVEHAIKSIKDWRI
ncbi:hypothetical protein FOCC_FOCC015278 [Frankliniella occidentalis]|nr:hypothetical protein FOCC_FOCC015278 [Frankliniella occidentalis]